MSISPRVSHHKGSTFSLHVTLDHGTNTRTEGELNKACQSPQDQFCGYGLSDIASSIFSGASSTSDREQIQGRFFVASASKVGLSIHPMVEPSWKNALAIATTEQTSTILVFVPPHLIASTLEKHLSSNRMTSGSSFWVDPPCSEGFASDLLPKLHPTLFEGCKLKGIVLTSIAAENGPAEIVLLEVPTIGSKGIPNNYHLQENILRPASGSVIAGDTTNNHSVLKILPVASIEFTHKQEKKDSHHNSTAGQAIEDTKSLSNITHNQKSFLAPEIPACPVCIHRIDPIKLGLPAPTVQNLCSQFCTSPSLLVDSWLTSEDDRCHKQKLLNKWSSPARCKACQVIDHYWNYNNTTHLIGTAIANGHDGEDRDLFCAECSMHNTLWTCLTCGFVGCGRYSNKHSVAHFEQTKHPYSLELATLRIWDYCYGEYGGFVQRADLLECPSSPPLLFPWLTRGLDLSGSLHPNTADTSAGNLSHRNSDSIGNHDQQLGDSMAMQAAMRIASPSKNGEKSSKKVALVGEEYEALLQSALEDQAQHYEDAITRLHAEHTNSLLDRNNLGPEELQMIETLKLEIQVGRDEIEKASKDLIEAQAREAELRLQSQRLLSQQQESNELLKKIQEEHQKENEEGKLQIEDLEQQIADLSANLRMRQQISQSNELTNAQIFGTTTLPDAKPQAGRRGKKKGRFFRK